MLTQPNHQGGSICVIYPRDAHRLSYIERTDAVQLFPGFPSDGVYQKIIEVFWQGDCFSGSKPGQFFPLSAQIALILDFQFQALGDVVGEVIGTLEAESGQSAS